MAPSANPPLPPDIAQQQQSGEEQPRQSVFSPDPSQQQAGGKPGGPQGAAQQIQQQIQQKVQQLDSWAGEMKNLLGNYDPSMLPFLEQIGRVAVELVSAIESKSKRSGAATGKPEVQPQPPMNPAAPPPSPNAA